MTAPLIEASYEQWLDGGRGLATILRIRLVRGADGALARKPWAAGKLPRGPWYEVTQFRADGERLTTGQVRAYYRRWLGRLLDDVAPCPLVMQVGRTHARLLARAATHAGAAAVMLAGSLADEPPIADRGPNGGSDDEQIVALMR